jgi:predicted MFS family arabinose efflux permease
LSDIASESLLKRWYLLMTVFVTRLTMAFQFQNVPIVSTELRQAFEFDFWTIGLLTGLYMLPGAVLSVPVGRVAQRCGDRNTLSIGLLLMALGGGLCYAATSGPVFFAGRLTSAFGAVVPFVLMSKVLTDHFTGPRLNSAMAIGMTGWPFGIALSLMTFGIFGSNTTWPMAFITGAVLALCCLVLIQGLPKSSEQAGSASPAGVFSVSKFPFCVRRLIIIAGLVCAFYNSAYVVLHTYLPIVLRGRGFDAHHIGLVVSLNTWLAIIAMPVGGLIADRLKRPVIFMAGTMLVAALAMLLMLWLESPLVGVIILGLIGSAPAGFIPALCSQVVAAPDRARGFGIFYAVFYAGMAVIPMIAGWVADGTGAAQNGVTGATVLMCLALLTLATYEQLRTIWRSSAAMAQSKL